MSETLEQQAVKAGIDLGYHDINGIYHATKPEVLESIVAVLDKSKADSDGLYLEYDGRAMKTAKNLYRCRLNFMVRKRSY